MTPRRKWIGIGAAALAAAGIGTGAALAAGGDDSEPPISGDALTRASAAALAHTGGGEVTDTEVGDEDAFYEVEVTLPDGSRVDVHLDEDFDVVGAQPDLDEPGDEDGEG